MDKFSELIAKGVASFDYVDIVNHDDCSVCRSYNNIFGVATDTHMTCVDDKYVVTGHIISTQNKFDDFIWSRQYNGVYFQHAGFNSLSEWMQKNNLKGGYGVVNNDNVYIMTAKTEEDTDAGLPADIKTPTAMITFNTDESMIPQSVRFITKTNSVSDFTVCEDLKSLNESKAVYGDNWCVAYLSDGPHLTCTVNGKNILINV